MFASPSLAEPSSTSLGLANGQAVALAGLTQLFEDRWQLGGVKPRWTDALLAETRAQLSGCVTAIETSLRLALDDAIQDLDTKPVDGISSVAAVLNHDTIAHFRLRSALTLIMRAVQTGMVRPYPLSLESGSVAEDELGEDTSPNALADALLALALQEKAWMAARGDRQPMRPDVPSTIYADLVYAVLAFHLSQISDISSAGRSAMIEAAAALIARHRDVDAPTVRAKVCIEQAERASRTTETCNQALDEGRVLLSLAQASQRSGVCVDRLGDLLFTGPITLSVCVLRAAGIDFARLVAFAPALAQVRSDLSDDALPAWRMQFDTIDEGAALVQLLRYAGPDLLVEKLNMLGHRST